MLNQLYLQIYSLLIKDHLGYETQTRNDTIREQISSKIIKNSISINTYMNITCISVKPKQLGYDSMWVSAMTRKEHCNNIKDKCVDLRNLVCYSERNNTIMYDTSALASEGDFYEIERYLDKKRYNQYGEWIGHKFYIVGCIGIAEAKPFNKSGKKYRALISKKIIRNFK